VSGTKSRGDTDSDLSAADSRPLIGSKTLADGHELDCPDTDPAFQLSLVCKSSQKSVSELPTVSGRMR
jgi:hypothetical protein